MSLKPVTTILSELSNTGYIGRFAPSPSGPLHFGSLVTALASYLDAKASKGKWLVRMEDLDPPREQPGAADAILQSLDAHGLHWDDSIVYQSTRHDAYRSCLDNLIQSRFVYSCTCSRQDLIAMKGVYDGRCRHRQTSSSEAYSLRLKLYDLPDRSTSELITFDDVMQGQQAQHLRTQAGDQIVRRRDGFYAYLLAVVVDDIAQGITHIIRGSDLLDVTGRQLFFFDLLGAVRPQVGHVPLALQANGQKLSKQNRAPPLSNCHAGKNIWHALEFLGQQPPSALATEAVMEIVNWGVSNWRRGAVNGLGRVLPHDILAPHN